MTLIKSLSKLGDLSQLAISFVSTALRIDCKPLEGRHMLTALKTHAVYTGHYSNACDVLLLFGTVVWKKRETISKKQLMVSTRVCIMADCLNRIECFEMGRCITIICYNQYYLPSFARNQKSLDGFYKRI